MRGLRAWVILMATLLGVVATGLMGRWQLQRAEAKQLLHDTMVARAQMPALSVQSLPCSLAQWQAQLQRPVVLTGRWLADKTLFLDNRPMAGRAGFVVLTPLQLEAVTGCQATVVLVQRGWVPRDPQDRLKVPPVSTPTGWVQVQARVVPAPSNLLQLGEGGVERGPVRQNVSLEALAQEWQLALRPGSLQELGASNGARHDGLLRHWWQPSADVGKHQAYAAQWFGMAAVMLGLYLWFQWVKPRWRAPS